MTTEQRPDVAAAGAKRRDGGFVVLPQRRIVTAGRIVAAALLVVGAAIVVVAWLQGYRWFTVETPSMGRAAPVGTLVVTHEPAAGHPLAVGQLITFHPPTAPGLVYTHRIVAIDAAGSITTRGDINGSVDGWRLTSADVIGRAVAVIPALGFLQRGLPVLAGGIALVWVLTALIGRPDRRAAARLVGVSLAVSATVWWVKPFVNLVLLAAVPNAGATDVAMVSTGLLPIRVSPSTAPSHSLRLVDGQVGALHVPLRAGSAGYHIDSSLALEPWQWVVVVALCLTPLAWSLFLSPFRRLGDEAVAGDAAAVVHPV